jgi:hypothetical protein
MFALSNAKILRGMTETALLYPRVREASLAFVVGPEQERVESLTSFIGAHSSESFKKLLTLASLHVAEGYHRSAFEILQMGARFEFPTLERAASNSLLVLGNTILEGTFKIGATTVNQSTSDLYETYWPAVARQLPRNAADMSERYGSRFDMGQGELVNQLRSVEDSGDEALIARARTRAPEVIDALFTNRVYGWVIDFLVQSQKHALLSPQLHNDTVARLDGVLREANSHVCRWHREEALRKNNHFGL